MKQDMDDCSVTEGSGNIFADLGVSEPDLALKKSELAAKIRETIEANEWTQAQAAAKMGIDQPKVSAIVRGRLEDFSIDRLLVGLERLGQGVTFVFRPIKDESDNGKVKRTARRSRTR